MQTSFYGGNMNKKNCERCGKSLTGFAHTMSKLNTEVICMDCKRIERYMSIYSFADEVEVKELKKGNRNFEGVLNSKNYILAEFYLMVEGVKRHFKFIGEVALDNDCLEFDNIFIMELTDGKLSEFKITATTWAGITIDEDDAMADVISRYSRKDTTMEMISLHDTLKDYVAKLDEAGTVNVNGREIPKSIYYEWDMREYELILATEEYLYYANLNYTVLLDAKTSELIADDNFADNGYCGSVVNIAKGTETMFYLNESNEEDFYELQKSLLEEEEEEEEE